MVAPPSFAEKMSVLPSDFLVPIQVEPVGRWFLAHYERMNCTRGTSIGQAHDMFSRIFPNTNLQIFSTKYHVLFVYIFSNDQN